MNAPRLYTILDLGYTPESRAQEATASLIAGGADILQLRAKNHDLATIRRIAEKLIPLCRAAGVPFILNDHPALAVEIGADGVHLGQDDGPLADAKHQLQRGIHSGLHSFIHSSSPSSSSSQIPDPPSPISPPRPFLIGRSTHSLAQARAALAEGFDYIGFGPLFPTPTKAGRPAIGLAEIAAMEHAVGAHLPAYCIGGITPDTLTQVLAAGARRVVIVSALLQAPNIESATRALKSKIPMI